MTYGELHDLFFDGANLKPDFNKKTKTEGNWTDLVSKLDDKMCVTIAESTIINDEVNTEGENRNHIYLSAIFHDAGYNVSENPNDNYIINSVDGDPGSGPKGKNARIWVSLGISRDELKKLTPSSTSGKWNQKATTLYTYIKGAGTPTNSSNSCLSASTRKYQ